MVWAQTSRNYNACFDASYWDGVRASPRCFRGESARSWHNHSVSANITRLENAKNINLGSYQTSNPANMNEPSMRIKVTCEEVLSTMFMKALQVCLVEQVIENEMMEGTWSYREKRNSLILIPMNIFNISKILIFAHWKSNERLEDILILLFLAYEMNGSHAFTKLSKTWIFRWIIICFNPHSWKTVRKQQGLPVHSDISVGHFKLPHLLFEQKIEKQICLYTFLYSFIFSEVF